MLSLIAFVIHVLLPKYIVVKIWHMLNFAFVEGEEFGVPMLSHFVYDKFTVTACDSFDLVDGSLPSGTYNNHYNAIMIYHYLNHLESYNNNPDMTVITFFLPSKFTL